MTKEAVLKVLRKRIAQRGAAAQYARNWGLSPSSLCDILAGRREPNDAVLDALGLVRVVTYKAKVPA